MRQLEGWLGTPLAKAGKRYLTKLKTRLRRRYSGQQFAQLQRILYKASAQDELHELRTLKQRLKKIRASRYWRCLSSVVSRGQTL